MIFNQIFEIARVKTRAICIAKIALQIAQHDVLFNDQKNISVKNNH